MNKLVLKGTGVALITPFDHNKDVDIEALKQVVNYQIDNGIDYLVVLGTTAETATLTTEEKEIIKRIVLETNAGRLPVVLGIGSNNTMAVVEEIKTTDLKGFDALLSVSPYYNKPTQEGIYMHFAEISKASPLPIILYNVPGRTASNMSVDTIVRLASEFDNIIGVKEAAGDLLQAFELIRRTPEEFLIISGDDMITLPMVLAGGAGVISVIAQGFPKAFSDMVRFGLEGNSRAAFNIHHKIAPAIDMIFEQGNPAGIKTVFKHLSLPNNHVRLPLVEVNEDLDNRLKGFVQNF